MFGLGYLQLCAIAAVLSGFLAARFRRTRSGWSRRRRIVSAAAPLPAMAFGLMLVLAVYSLVALPADGENGWGAAIFYIIILGVPGLVVLGLGALAGAFAGDRWRA